MAPYIFIVTMSSIVGGPVVLMELLVASGVGIAVGAQHAIQLATRPWYRAHPVLALASLAAGLLAVAGLGYSLASVDAARFRRALAERVRQGRLTAGQEVAALAALEEFLSSRR